MEGVVMQEQSQQPLQQQVPPQPVVVERLNQAVVQQLNLESVKTRAISLFKAISRILEDFDAYGRTNTTPKWFVIPSFMNVYIYLCYVLLIHLLIMENLALIDKKAEVINNQVLRVWFRNTFKI